MLLIYDIESPRVLGFIVCMVVVYVLLLVQSETLLDEAQAQRRSLCQACL